MKHEDDEPRHMSSRGDRADCSLGLYAVGVGVTINRVAALDAMKTAYVGGTFTRFSAAARALRKTLLDTWTTVAYRGEIEAADWMRRQYRRLYDREPVRPAQLKTLRK